MVKADSEDGGQQEERKAWIKVARLGIKTC
jgi:hypothetical protein